MSHQNEEWEAVSSTSMRGGCRCSAFGALGGLRKGSLELGRAMPLGRRAASRRFLLASLVIGDIERHASTMGLWVFVVSLRLWFP